MNYIKWKCNVLSIKWSVELFPSRRNTNDNAILNPFTDIRSVLYTIGVRFHNRTSEAMIHA